MTSEQVTAILQGTFADEADRRYWEMKLAELKRKEATAAQNEQYVRKMAVYDR